MMLSKLDVVKVGDVAGNLVGRSGRSGRSGPASASTQGPSTAPHRFAKTSEPHENAATNAATNGNTATNGNKL